MHAWWKLIEQYSEYILVANWQHDCELLNLRLIDCVKIQFKEYLRVKKEGKAVCWLSPYNCSLIICLRLHYR